MDYHFNFHSTSFQMEYKLVMYLCISHVLFKHKATAPSSLHPVKKDKSGEKQDVSAWGFGTVLSEDSLLCLSIAALSESAWLQGTGRYRQEKQEADDACFNRCANVVVLF